MTTRTPANKVHIRASPVFVNSEVSMILGMNLAENTAGALR